MRSMTAADNNKNGAGHVCGLSVDCSAEVATLRTLLMLIVKQRGRVKGTLQWSAEEP